jgi:hypothetical protein
VWKFQDLHNEFSAPAHIHRLPKKDIKHVNTIDAELMITNNGTLNVDVYGIDSECVLKTLNIQGREMNCSVVAGDRVLIGTRDRRVFVFTKHNLEMAACIEVPEEVHCMCLLSEGSRVAVGMTDGHLWLIDVAQPAEWNRILMNEQFRETGNMYSICGINNDTELAVGTASGVHIIQIDAFSMKKIDAHKFDNKTVWNICEYDENKIAVSCWEDH